MPGPEQAVARQVYIDTYDEFNKLHSFFYRDVECWPRRR